MIHIQAFTIQFTECELIEKKTFFFFFSVLAAHCFWNKDLSSKIIRNDNSLYKIGVGKYNRNISVKDNDHTQIMDVS